MNNDNMKYFVVSMDDDGEWSFDIHDDIDSVIHDYGIDDVDDYEDGYNPAQDFRETIDDEHPGNVLIKGVILLPTKKEVVTKYEFEPKKPNT